jgi:hypothetical protein
MLPSTSNLQMRALAAVVIAVIGTSASAEALAADQARPVRLECTDLPKGGPGDVVRALYAAYPFGEERPGRPPFWDEPREILTRYFDARLTGLFVADQACQARFRAMCDVTFDLLSAGQDGEPTGHRFCRSGRGPEWVDVRFMILGKERVVSFLTTPSAAGWRISNMLFPEGATLLEMFTHPPY